MNDFQKLIQKVEELKKGKNFDLSLEEDLSLAVMNLISLEEHFFLTAEKTGKDDYLELLNKTREIRKNLMGRMFEKHEGETWCISKHLLGTTMRIMEVATKLQTSGKNKDAKDMFAKAYEVYSLFWAVRLKLLDLSKVKEKPLPKESSWSETDLVTKLIDCCKE
jgi:hypothetical protein